MENLKTFEDACKIEGLDAEVVLAGMAGFPDLDRGPLTAMAKLLIIARAANRQANGGQEWKPDWSNYSEYKYTPYFEPGGSSGFRFDGFGHWFAFSCVGSRLCFISSEVAEHVGKTFSDLYEQFMVIK